MSKRGRRGAHLPSRLPHAQFGPGSLTVAMKIRAGAGTGVMTAGGVRPNGYRVEWLGLDGRVSRGPGNQVVTDLIGRPEKRSWFVDYLSRRVSRRIRRAPDGRRQVTLDVASSATPPADLDTYDWPEHLPAFRTGRSTIARDGYLWV